jgi:hypothetical protein
MAMCRCSLYPSFDDYVDKPARHSMAPGFRIGMAKRSGSQRRRGRSGVVQLGRLVGTPAFLAGRPFEDPAGIVPFVTERSSRCGRLEDDRISKSDSLGQTPLLLVDAGAGVAAP